MKPLNRTVDKIYLMYSDEKTTFSKEFLNKASKGQFIEEDPVLIYG